MSIESFDPAPAAVRSVAGAPAGAADPAPRRRAALGQAGGLQLRHRVRRQQDPQAGVPGGRRAGPGLRHARLDRRRAVQPHPPGRGGRGAAWGCGACSSRRAGSTGRTRSTTRSATSCSAGSPAPTCGWCGPGSGSASRRAGSRRSREVEERGGRPYAIPAGASDHPLGGLGFARLGVRGRRAGAELGVFFDTIVVCSVTGSTQAGMVAGFAALRASRAAAAPRARHRRVRQAGRDPRAGRPRIAREHGRADRRRAATCATTRSSSTTATTPASTASPTSRPSTRCALAARTEGMITDPVYEGKSMAALVDLVTTGEIAPDSTVLYAHLGGQPALNGYSALFS